MRAGIGLIGLLLAVGLVFYLMFGGPGNPGSVRTDLEAKKQADTFVNQISGKDAKGELATDSISIEAGSRGILVKTVEPGGAFAQHFGIQPNDVILDIGPLDAKTQATDDETAKAFLHRAYAQGWQLVVQRGAERVTLPTSGNPAPQAPTMQSVQSPPDQQAAPQQAPQRMNPSLQAHNLIDKIQSH